MENEQQAVDAGHQDFTKMARGLLDSFQACIQQGDYHTALQMAEHALGCAARAEDWELIAFARAAVAFCQLWIGQHLQAEQTLLRWLRDQPHYPPEEQARAPKIHYNLALVYEELRHYPAALPHLQTAQEGFLAQGDLAQAAMCALEQGWIHLFQERPTEADSCLGVAASWLASRPQPRLQWLLTCYRALYERVLGHHEASMAICGEVLAGGDGITAYHMAEAAFVAALNSFDRGRLAEAQAYLDQAHEYARQFGYQRLIKHLKDLQAQIAVR